MRLDKHVHCRECGKPIDAPTRYVDLVGDSGVGILSLTVGSALAEMPTGMCRSCAIVELREDLARMKKNEYGRGYRDGYARRPQFAYRSDSYDFQIECPCCGMTLARNSTRCSRCKIKFKV